MSRLVAFAAILVFSVSLKLCCGFICEANLS